MLTKKAQLRVDRKKNKKRRRTNKPVVARVAHDRLMLNEADVQPKYTTQSPALSPDFLGMFHMGFQYFLTFLILTLPECLSTQTGLVYLLVFNIPHFTEGVLNL